MKVELHVACAVLEEESRHPYGLALHEMKSNPVMVQGQKLCFSPFLGILLFISSVPLYGSQSKLGSCAFERFGALVTGCSFRPGSPKLNSWNLCCSSRHIVNERMRASHFGFLVLRGGGKLIKRRHKEARAKMKDRMSRAIAVRKRPGSIVKKGLGTSAAVAEYIKVDFCRCNILIRHCFFGFTFSKVCTPYYWCCTHSASGKSKSGGI
jgi:hypothetical protein